MMKRTVFQLIIGIGAILILMSSCRNHELNALPESLEAPKGYIPISFRISQSDMDKVEVRSVDPDGQDIQTMSLFCFNAYGLFLGVRDGENVVLSNNQATDSGGHKTSGEYKTDIPEETAIIHFIANLNPKIYEDRIGSFINQTEAEVLGAMEGGSGMMIYWNRFEKDPSKVDEGGKIKDIQTQLAELEGISLIRNHAKVTLQNAENYQDFIINGFVVTNIHAFGTVAPFCKDHGFAIHSWPPEADGHYSVSLAKNTAMMSDITDVNLKTEDYIFEHENTLDNPVSVIIRGHYSGQTASDDLYYRAMILDTVGNIIPILRNHHYIMKIKGALSYGQPTFEKALTAPATNNVWVSIDSWVKEVADEHYKLSLTETSKVFHEDMAGTAYSFEYTLTNADGSLTGITAPDVSWLKGNNVGRQSFVHTFDPTTGKGHIAITLEEENPNIPEQTGTLMIQKGRLYRTIDISMISTQEFKPAWISAQVFSYKSSENVTLMFTIPETCPASLFPFSVYISANHLDIRSESGQQLPIVVKGEEGYYGKDWDGIGYKYEYPVTGPGKYRVFMHTLLTHEDGDIEEVHLEANFFRTITKPVTFAGTEGKAIFVDNTATRKAHYAYDEDLYYMLVPQKKASPVVLELALKERNVADDGTVSYVELNHKELQNAAMDEFLFYSKNLSFYDGYFDDPNDYDVLTDEWETQVVYVNEDLWSENGRVMGLRTNKNGEAGLKADGKYNVYMLTNNTNNQDVVRISSNNKESKYVFAADRSGTSYGETLYGGNEYRSFIFDIGHYRPFRFAAQVKVGEGENVTSVGTLLSNEKHKDAEEVVDPLSFTYEPNQKVDIMLDVTSFKGEDGRSVHPFGESFGESFDIYIDAPMLDVDKSRVPDSWLKEKTPSLPADKLRKDPNVEGRFIYTVEKTRKAERDFGTAPAINTDEAIEAYNEFGEVISVAKIDQTGERKLLPFVKSSIAVKGDIVISSDTAKVVFWEKRFDVSTEKIMGTIQYYDGATTQNVPKDAFVAFVRALTRSRIGSITVTSDGHYELNLRSEYEFNWTDEIEFDCKINGVAYDYKVYTENGETKNLTLEYLFNNPNVTLVEATTVINE